MEGALKGGDSVPAEKMNSPLAMSEEVDEAGAAAWAGVAVWDAETAWDGA